MTTSPLDQAACLALAQRHVGDVTDWTPDDWAAQLAEDSVVRGDPPQTYYRPYCTALTYLARPGMVKARSEGDVSEQYTDPTLTISRLERLDAEWEADVLPAKAAADSGEWSGAVEWGLVTRGSLQRLRREDVEIWRAAEVQVGELGERRQVHGLANVYQGLVTPLGADAALKLGLTTSVERWRTRLPADADVQLSDRVRVRGRDWQIVSLTRWHSYVLIVFEGV